MKFFYVMRGLPASGKSSQTKALVNQLGKDNVIVVSNDIITHNCCNSKFHKKFNETLKSIDHQLLDFAMSNNLHVIVDNTNLNPDTFNRYKMFHNSHHNRDNYKFKVFDLTDVPVRECIERDKYRENSVGKKVIMDMALKYGIYDQYVPMINDDLPKCVLYDLDGTVALKHDNRSYYDASTSDLDIPNTHVINVLKTLKFMYPNIPFIVFSGREEKDKEPSLKFLNKYEIPVNYIYMRENDDYRSDDIIKYELYKNHIENEYSPIAIFDDRLSVCKMWVDLKLPLFCVGDFTDY